MNTRNHAVILSLLAVMTLTMAACTKTKKTSSAGGGPSSQSVLTFRGAAR